MSWLKKLDYDEGRVVSFSVSSSQKRIIIREECDGYFCLSLNKNEFRDLIKELKQLHDLMK